MRTFGDFLKVTTIKCDMKMIDVYRATYNCKYDVYYSEIVYRAHAENGNGAKSDTKLLYTCKIQSVHIWISDYFYQNEQINKRIEHECVSYFTGYVIEVIHLVIACVRFVFLLFRWKIEECTSAK